jgi:hypothetical protein
MIRKVAHYKWFPYYVTQGMRDNIGDDRTLTMGGVETLLLTFAAALCASTSCLAR